MVGRAIRGKKPVITNDISADPGAGGPRRDEALRKGLHSIIAMPLMLEGEIAATLTLFAKERNFFSGDEMKLLTELAGDISFALDHLASQAACLCCLLRHAYGPAEPDAVLERLSQHCTRPPSLRAGSRSRSATSSAFGRFNETLGRQAGDELLKQIAVRLPKNMRNPEISRVSRATASPLSLPDIRDLSVVAHLVENLHDEAPSVVHGRRAGIEGFAGDRHRDLPQRRRRCGNAVSKRRGRTQEGQGLGRDLSVLRTLAQREVAETLRLENKLHRAIETEQFVLHYQPKVNSKSGSIASVEALIRWQDPEIGLVPPGQFIPLLEETGMILEVGFWAIRKALYDFGRWRAADCAARAFGERLDDPVTAEGFRRYREIHHR